MLLLQLKRMFMILQVYSSQQGPRFVARSQRAARRVSERGNAQVQPVHGRALAVLAGEEVPEGLHRRADTDLRAA